MKNTTIITLAAMLLGTAGAIAQEAFTKPAGFVTHTLKANQFNLIGLTLHQPVLVAGELDDVTGTTLGDDEVNFGATLTTGKTYILEITDASDSDLNGTIQEITAWSGSDLTTPQDLAAQGVVAGDKYQLRQAPTLEDVFGTTGSVLKKGVIFTLADVVWIPNGVGGYNRYFLSTSNEWKNAATNTASPNVALCYVDAVFLQRKGADVDLVLTGSVKVKATTVALAPGFNPVSVVVPVGSTLQNSGLNDSLQAGVIFTLADLVWIPNTSGGYDRYFYHTSGNWRNAATNTNLASDVPLSSGFFIQRKGSAKNATIKTPSSYSNL